MTGFLPAAFAIVLALAGAAILCSAFTWPFRKRRAGAGVLLFAASGLCLWVLWGSPLAQPRAVVIVISEHAKAEDLHVAASSLQPWDRIAWVRIAARAAEGSRKTPVWMSAESARLGPQETQKAYQQRVLDSAAVVAVKADDWLGPIVSADRKAREDPLIASSAAYHNTLLFLHDPGEVWTALSPRGAQFSKSGDRPSVLAELQQPPTDAFLLPAPSSERPGKLTIEMNMPVLPALAVSQLSAPDVKLRLDGAKSVRRKGAVYKVKASIDDLDGKGFRLKVNEKEELEVTDADPSEPLLPKSLELDSFKPSANLPGKEEPLAEGFHRLHVKLSVPVERNGISSSVEYSATHYFKVEKRTFMLVHGEKSKLASRDPAAMFRKFLREHRKNNQPGRTSLSDDLLHAFTFDQKAEIKAALEHCRALVLVEPDAEFLRKMDKELQEKIADGMAVLVVGPPPRDGQGMPAWLPATAKPVDGNDATPQRVHRERRLYFVPDNSRLMRFPAWSEIGGQPTLTGLTAQQNIIDTVCKNLNVADSLAKVHGDGVNNYVTPVDNPQARHGKLPENDTPISVFPPTSYYLHLQQNEIAKAAEQWRLESAASFVPMRLRRLEKPVETIQDFEPVEAGHLYPGSAVVLFIADMPQPTELANRDDLVKRLVPNPPAGDVAADAEALTRLARQGVTVYVVKILLPAGHKASLQQSAGGRGREIADYLSEAKKDPKLAEFIIEAGDVDFSDRFSAARAHSSWREVAASLTERLSKHESGQLTRQRTGRVIDERTKPEREMPGRHFLLLREGKPDPLEPDHATFQGGPPLPPGSEPMVWPALVARSHGEGHVVVSAYSPFADDMWKPDGGLPEETKATRMDGWGVQRLIDLADLTAPRRRVPKPDRPVVYNIREAEDGATIWVDCWAVFKDGKWDEPLLRKKKEVIATGRAVKVDRLTQSITFEFRAKEALTGANYEFVLGSKEGLYVNLLPSTESGRSVKEALARLTRLTGGAEISSATAVEALRFHRPAPWFAGLALVLVAMALFAPPLRAWAFLRRWRKSGDPALKDVRPTAHFDIDAVLIEWGLNVGEPRAARQAGLPGGQKPFESGDSLSMAKPASLFPLTSAGSQVLPATRPVMRRRHVTRGMEAVLLLDCTASLLVPDRKPGKVDYVELIARLIAGAVWSYAGTIQIRSLQHRSLVWGPRPAGDDADDLARFVREAIAQGAAAPWGKLQPPEDLVPGQVLFMISDLLAPRADDLPKVLGFFAAEGIDFRLVHLVGATDRQMFGLGCSALTGFLLDRSEWDEADMNAAIQEHAAALKQIVEAGAGRFASVSTDLGAGDLFGRLVAQEFFQ